MQCSNLRAVGNYIIDKSEFEAELNDLICRAANSGVEIAGDYPVYHPSPEAPNYDILVTKLVSNVDTELDQ